MTKKILRWVLTQTSRFGLFPWRCGTTCSPPRLWADFTEHQSDLIRGSLGDGRGRSSSGTQLGPGRVKSAPKCSLTSESKKEKRRRRGPGESALRGGLQETLARLRFKPTPLDLRSSDREFNAWWDPLRSYRIPVRRDALQNQTCNLRV